MFDTEPVEAVFEKHGFSVHAVPDARLPQRRFENLRERKEVLTLLHNRGIDTAEWEEQGKHFADLYVAARPEHCMELLDCVYATRSECEEESMLAGYIRR